MIVQFIKYLKTYEIAKNLEFERTPPGYLH